MYINYIWFRRDWDTKCVRSFTIQYKPAHVCKGGGGGEGANKTVHLSVVLGINPSK